MGLRFFRVTGWGWVAEIGCCLAGCADHLAKSATNFRNASIHLLPFWQYILRSELPLSLFLRGSPDTRLGSGSGIMV